jgi:hypothetical protein
MAVVLVVPGVTPTSTSRILSITSESAKPTVAFQSFDANPVRVYDINGDGRQEIVSQNDNQWVYVFDSQSGALLFETTTVFPAGWGARSFNGPELAVFSSGGKTRLIVENSAAVVTSFLFDASTSVAGKLTFVKEWEIRLDGCHDNPGADSKPVLADLDNDGTLEVLAATEESGLYALRADGTVYWKNCIGGGNAEPSVGDLDLDGSLEVVFGSDGGVVTAMEGRTGKTRWSYNLLQHYALGSGSIPVGVTIAQLDGSGGPEIVLGARDSHDGSDFSKDHALLLALGPTGTVLWGFQDPSGNPLTYTRPVVVDADHDGAAEVYWGDWNTIGHKPPWNEADAWKVTGPGHYYRFDRQGKQTWRTSLGSWWSNKDVPLADVDGDDVQEMLANGPGPSGHDGVWYLSTKDGTAETFVDLYPWKLKRAPVIADLGGTGTMQWVAEADAADSSAGGPAILVYDTGAAYDSAWPHPPARGFEPAPSTSQPAPTGTSHPPTSSRPTSSSTSSGLLPPLPVVSSVTGGPPPSSSSTSATASTTPTSSTTSSSTTAATPTSTPPTPSTSTTETTAPTTTESSPTNSSATLGMEPTQDSTFAPRSDMWTIDHAEGKSAPEARRTPGPGVVVVLLGLSALALSRGLRRSPP